MVAGIISTVLPLLVKLILLYLGNAADKKEAKAKFIEFIKELSKVNNSVVAKDTFDQLDKELENPTKDS